ncbi:cyclin-dependent protein serine/threonine kinase regulator SSN8 NDAI_0G00700 [Naumovozyma dairenensis CBS 421]|uniref:RNA polymerase II holoenzyme cyclin-like subunit n=1 Tax=Naumovozyma dairenensis (strain ATCC 10597 / BCRC 20456 / CBS 421 / NBRC 0211 / NRRL Y-12639) TaxID=1071378 RepID=G0WDI5_NAUDC|nr:hypothetical protein NDAI_0G00700 [Naumovozyma dairenensis CBS 421]CCD25846.2 hypothetical protein NDAI_0G00700 [Naumovozyma dairenensis CBS 421]
MLYSFIIKNNHGFEKYHSFISRRLIFPFILSFFQYFLSIIKEFGNYSCKGTNRENNHLQLKQLSYKAILLTFEAIPYRFEVIIYSTSNNKMSGTYWTSTQRHSWQYTKSSLAKERQKLWILECQLFPQGLNITMDTRQNQSNDQQQQNTNGNGNGKTNHNNTSTVITSTTKNIPITHRDLHYDKDYNLRIYCYFLIMKLGRRLNIRQCALATAHVYLSRFLLKVSVREVNLYLLATTTVYLACKVEECPQYIRTLVSEARSLWPEFVPPDPTKVTEFEFYLLEELESYLVVHHPYRSLEQIVNVLKQEPYQLNINAEELQNCWSLINDSYITDANLIYPPHIIAIASLFITISMKKNEHSRSSSRNNITTNDENQNDKVSSSSHSHRQEILNLFIAESLIDLEEVMDTIQTQITLYDHWDKYHEPWVKFLLHTLYLRPSPVSAS